MKFLDQMKWATEPKSIGLSNESVNLTEWKIQGGDIYGNAKPIVTPDVDRVTEVAQLHKDYKIIVLNIEGLRTKITNAFPGSTEEEREMMEYDIRSTYYNLFKAAAPDSLVMQYNQNNDQNSDGFWISAYRTKKQTPADYCNYVLNTRWEKLNLTGKPVFLNTSPVVFDKDGDYVMDSAEFSLILETILADSKGAGLEGISFWYSVGEKKRLPFTEQASKCYDVIYKFIIKDCLKKMQSDITDLYFNLYQSENIEPIIQVLNKDIKSILMNINYLKTHLTASSESLFKVSDKLNNSLTLLKDQLSWLHPQS